MKIQKALLSSAVAVASSFLAIQAIQTDAEGRGYGIRNSGESDKNKKAVPSALPSHEALRQALVDVVAGADSAGFGLNMWATIVDRDGIVRAVVFSGGDRGDQWPGSRVISAQKANTANAFSLPGLALATSNLFTAVQPGQSLFGLQESNPVNPAVAYKGPAQNFGQPNDPMVGQRIGGVNVFGGGLPLYAPDGELVGAIGVSGDTSCTDHIIAWKVRHAINLDNVPAGVAPGVEVEGEGEATTSDNAVYDIVDGVSTSGWGHPGCGGGQDEITAALLTTHPLGPEE